MSWKNFSPKEAEGADVIIIGSGMSGLCCAALLGKRGKRVVVLEQHDIAGGHIHSFKQGTEWVNAGWHYVGTLRSISRVLWDEITDKMPMKETAADEIVDTNYGHPGLSKNTYSEAMGGIPVKEFRRVSDYWTSIVIVKLAPAIVAAVFWFWFWATGKLKEAMMPYGAWCRKHAKNWTKAEDNEVWWTQRGDHGMPRDQTTAIVGCAVAGHYAFGVGYPEGGTYEAVVRMCKTVKARGGSVLVKAKVDEIALAEDKKTVKGVVVGSHLVEAPIVIVAGAWTLTQLLPKERVPKTLKAVVEKCGPSPQHGCVFITLAGETRDSIGMPTGNVWYKDKFFFSHKQTKTGVVVYAIWESSYYGRGAGYEDRKEDEAKAATDTLYKLFPKLKEAIVRLEKSGVADATTYDASTPATSQHYLQSWQGGSYGLAITRERCGDYKTIRALKPEVDGFKGLFLTGQDLMLPGVMSALMAGAVTAQAIVYPGWKGLFGNLLVELGKEYQAQASAAKKAS